MGSRIDIYHVYRGRRRSRTGRIKGILIPTWLGLKAHQRRKIRKKENKKRKKKKRPSQGKHRREVMYSDIYLERQLPCETTCREGLCIPVR